MLFSIILLTIAPNVCSNLLLTFALTFCDPAHPAAGIEAGRDCVPSDAGSTFLKTGRCENLRSDAVAKDWREDWIRRLELRNRAGCWNNGLGMVFQKNSLTPCIRRKMVKPCADLV